MTKTEAQAVLTRILAQEEALGVTYEVMQGKLPRTGDFRQALGEIDIDLSPTENKTAVLEKLY